MADSIRDSIRIRIVPPDSIGYSIRTETADLQVPTCEIFKGFLNLKPRFFEAIFQPCALDTWDVIRSRRDIGRRPN